MKGFKGKLQTHFSSEAHKSALLDFCNFMKKTNNIDIMLDKNIRLEKIQEERDLAFHTSIVSILLDIARTLGRQSLAFRGNNDDENGNFWQIVYLISRHCPLLKKWLDESKFRPYQTTYLSSQSQNEFIEVLGKAIRREVVSNIQNINFFSVMADTTPDLSHHNILSVVVRYVDDKGNPEERLFEVRQVKDKTGSGLANEIINVLQNNEIDLENLVFQSFDYASNMSGAFNGAHVKISDFVGRNIPYIACQAHRLNTFIEHSCEASLMISDMFALIQELYVFFASSTKRYDSFLQKLNEINNSLRLRNLSQTRWSARAESINSVWTSYTLIIDVFNEISQDKNFDKKTRTTAYALVKKMLSFDIILGIMFMKNIMYKMKLLTECLESKVLNILDALLLISTTLKTLDEINSDEISMNNLINSAVEFSKSLGINAENEFLKHHRRRLIPKRLDDKRENQNSFTFKEYYRKEFKIVLDSLTFSIRNHLDKSLNCIKPLIELMTPPLSKDYLIESRIDDVISFFPNNQHIDPLQMKVELEVLYDQCQDAIKMVDVAKLSQELKLMLPIANRLCHLILTAPLTVSENERCFSKLKLVKNYLRTTQTDSRLNSLILMSSEKDILDKLELEELAKLWVNLKKRRIKLSV